MARSGPGSGHSPFVRILLFFWHALDLLRRIFFTLVFLAIVAVLVFLFVGRHEVRVPNGAALVWVPQGDLVDQVGQGRRTLTAELFNERPRHTRVADLVIALKRAATDPRISLAVLKLDEMGAAGMAQLQELAGAIAAFRKSGKQVIAYAPSYDQKTYYLAAQADQVYMDPMGQVMLQGFGVYQHYFKDALDKLGVKVHVFRVGKYKSAVEPFIRNDMSPAARAANKAWLNTLWSAYKNDVASARKLGPGAIDDYIANYPDRLDAAQGDAAQVARNAGLVDKLVSIDDLRRKVAGMVGLASSNGTFRQIDDRQYLAATGGPDRGRSSGHDVGLVVIEGPIVDGRGWNDTAGGDTVSSLIRRARRDDGIAALVLRVDSPGGSVFASEQIRREVVRTREAGKPVVVSMSNLAASGGYWVSMNANQIWAHATTITGSIGIFGIVPTFQKPLNELGIHTDGLGTTPLAGAFRLDMPLSPAVQRSIQAVIDHGYQTFISNVAHARGMTVESVDRIAQGRVWSGEDARRIGLVDHIGGLQAATRAAARLAGLSAGRYELKPITPHVDTATRILRHLYGTLGEAGLRLPVPAWLSRLMHSDFAATLELGWLDDPDFMYARCFCRPDLGGRLR